jgi:hypothetical protein
MAAKKLAFAENYYSYRIPFAEQIAVFPAPTPDQATLNAIQGWLVAANTAFSQRQYQTAIDDYLAARSLIFGLLFPVKWPIGLSPQRPPLDVSLFAPLLSAGLETMNILPPNPGDPGPVSREKVDTKQLGALAKTAPGLHITETTGAAGVAAHADLAIASRYAAVGNAPAAEFYIKRANKESPKAVQALVKPADWTPLGKNAAGVGIAGAVEVREAEAELAAASERIVPGTLAKTAFQVVANPTADRTYTTLLDGNAVTLQWKGGAGPPVEAATTHYYEARKSIQNIAGLVPALSGVADLGLNLPHLYYYVIPLGLAEAYHALGDFTDAETEYFAAASYSYINPTIEVPYVWQRLAQLYLDWGNQLFRNDEAADALAVYEHVMMPDDSAPASTLYTMASLAPAATAGKTILQHLAAIIADPSQVGALGLNPVTAAILIEIKMQIVKIQGGLDYWGHWHATVPIWTFDYLQSLAVNFAQLAISAEKDVITFWDRADQSRLTRLQLSQSVAQAKSEVQAAKLQAQAANAEVNAYVAGVALADERAADAQANHDEYAATSAQAIVHQALQSQLNGGDDGDADQLNQLADQMTSGPYSISGSGATLAAAEQLSGSRLNREYEVDSLQRQANELALARNQAAAEATAAQARAAAAQAGVAVAQTRADGAAQTLDAFDDQFFTADVWQRMGEAQWRLYERYLGMTLKVAKLMQSAYNFENDQDLHLIRSDYNSGTVNGLLGADSLLADIESFSYDLVTADRTKPQPVRQTISLADRYPFLFETQFRKTGTMAFQTTIDDFDSLYPGTYAGRIRAIEAAVDGIVPVRGLSGTLTNEGISSYRVPASLVGGGSGLKYRVQNRETLVLSDYAVRQDDLLAPQSTRMLRIFEGAGLASTWTLSLPKAVNDIDYGAITDVRITFYYDARFDPDLRDDVIATLNARPGFTARQRGIPLRWLYPDAFFHFQDTGVLTFGLKKSDFRSNETNPILTDVGLQVATDGSVPAAGLVVRVGTPAHPARIAATMDANGGFSSSGGNPWAPLAAGTAVGDYTIEVTAADNPALAAGGPLDLSPIVNIALLIGYTFTPRS